MVNLKVWINDTVVYHSKNGQKATLSYMNKLYEIRLGGLTKNLKTNTNKEIL